MPADDPYELDDADACASGLDVEALHLCFTPGGLVRVVLGEPTETGGMKRVSVATDVFANVRRDDDRIVHLDVRCPWARVTRAGSSPDGSRGANVSVRYDEDEDRLVVSFSDHAVHVAEQARPPFQHSVFADYDADGNVLAVNVEDASLVCGGRP